MHADPVQLLQAVQRESPRTAARLPRALVAGATGNLGNEVLRRLAGSQRFAQVVVLAHEPITALLRAVHPLQVPGSEFERWPRESVEIGVVLFDPPRAFNERERALWTPEPAQLHAVANWLRGCGAHTLAVVLPHDQGRLPAALREGLASLDEQAVATLGFERVILLRAARKPGALPAGTPRLERLAHWMLSIARFMVPSSEQPVRASRVAELLDVALQLAPPGIHVASPERVWQASQQDVRGVAQAWLTPAAEPAG